jgi:hypothetical protein
MNPLLIIQAIQAGVSLIPEGLTLINEIKATFNETDQATIDKALAESTAAADAQHNEAQSL